MSNNLLLSLLGNKFENIIKDKLIDYQMGYDNQSWRKLKKDLPGKSVPHVYYFLIPVVIIISSFLIYQSIYNTKVVTKNYTHTLKRNNQTIREINKFVDKSSLNIQVNEKISAVGKDITNNHIDSLISYTKQDILLDQVAIIEESNTVKQISVDKEPSALFKIDFVDNCQPLIAQFKPLELSDTIIYYWEFGDGQFSNSKQPEHIYQEAGEYIVNLTVKYYHSENTYSAVKKIKVFGKPIADFDLNQEDNKVYFLNYSVNADNYTWNFNIPGLMSKLKDPVIYFNTEGKYIVSLVASNNDGCYDTIIKPINIEFQTTLFIPDAFKPDGNGICEEFGPKGIGLDMADYSMSIYDGYGKLVFKTKDINERWNGKIMNIGVDARRGVYQCIIKVVYENGQRIEKVKNIRLIK